MYMRHKTNLRHFSRSIWSTTHFEDILCAPYEPWYIVYTFIVHLPKHDTFFRHLSDNFIGNAENVWFAAEDAQAL